MEARSEHGRHEPKPLAGMVDRGRGRADLGGLDARDRLLGALFPAPRIGNNPATALPWMPFVGPMVLVVWGIVGFVLVWKWWRQRELVLVPRLAGLVGAAALAVMLSAVQLLPIAEYTAQTTRAASGGPHDIYPFSLAPVRIVELIWPNVAGSPFHGNSCWLEKVSDTKIWVPSLYFSGLTIVLALGAGSTQRRSSRAPLAFADRGGKPRVELW